MQLEDVTNSYPTIDESLLNQHKIVLQLGKQTIFSFKSQIYKEHEVTGNLQP